MINRYPYTDQHELNLDYILAQIKKLSEEYKEFVALNTITYAGLWDITKSYQKWTVVIDGGVGYMSLKPVPAGITILNTEYWTMVFDMYSVFKNDVVILGDSYAVDASAGGDSWASQVERNLPANINVYRSTVGGTGFASDLYISQNFLSMLQGLAITDKDAVKQIVILGGANDANLYNNGTASLTDIEDRIKDFMTYAKNNFINAKVKLGFVGWYLNTNRYTAYREVRDVYQNTANLFSNCAYFANGEVIMHNMNMINSLDFVHPVQAASDKLAKFAMSMISDGIYNDYYVTQPTLTPVTDVTLTGLNHSTAIFDNDKVQYNLIGNHYGNYLQIVFTNNVQADANGMYAAYVADVDNLPLIDTLYTDYCQLRCVVGIANQGSHMANVMINSTENKLGVRVINVEGFTTGWELRSILLPPITMRFDRRNT